MAARKTPASRKPDKLMRDALGLELQREDPVDGKQEKRLRQVARALVLKAIGGDVPAIKEICDRMDGKVPQGIGGSDESSEQIIVQLVHFSERAD